MSRATQGQRVHVQIEAFHEFDAPGSELLGVAPGGSETCRSASCDRCRTGMEYGIV